MLVISEGNSNAVDYCLFVARSLIACSMIFPTSMARPFTIAQRRMSLSWDTVVVCMVGVV